MISKEEWNSLKSTEIYGMFVQLKREIDIQNAKIEILETRMDRIRRIHDGN